MTLKDMDKLCDLMGIKYESAHTKEGQFGRHPERPSISCKWSVGSESFSVLVPYNKSEIEVFNENFFIAVNYLSQYVKGDS